MAEDASASCRSHNENASPYDSVLPMTLVMPFSMTVTTMVSESSVSGKSVLSNGFLFH